MSFDPNKASTEDSGVFGLPYKEKESKVVYLPVSWEPTTSYRNGTSKGPARIYEATKQVDLFDSEIEKPYEAGLFFKKEPAIFKALNKKAMTLSRPIIDKGGDIEGNAKLKKSLADVNRLSDQLNSLVEKEVASILKNQQIPALVGGDHSAPFGAFKAAGDHFKKFSILHFDAHSDTRNAYEGFQHSHASIMRNAIESIPQIEKLVQVGIRDFCEEEVEFMRANKKRMKVFFDKDIQDWILDGRPLSKLARRMVAELGKQVWISFDIDGLDATLCPNTGTPVPGGISFNFAIAIIREVALSGRRIIGFDLVEVAPDPKNSHNEWDAIIGARMLYKMTAWTLHSHGLRKKIKNLV